MDFFCHGDYFVVLVDVLPREGVEITLSNMINDVPAILSLSNVSS